MLAGAQPGYAWAGFLNRLQVQLWRLDGQLTLELVRNVSWFEPWTETGGLPRLVRPKPRLAGIHMDDAGLLWVMVHVADANWRAGARSTAERPFSYPDYARYFDTIVEVWDIAANQVVASQ